MAKEHQYWVVSPNVKDDRTKKQETVEKWKEVIRRDHVTIMGWAPEEKTRGHGVGPKFANHVQKGDIVLIARRKNLEPDVVGLGVVKGECEEKLYSAIYDDPVYVRKLRPLVPLQETPHGVPFLDVVNCTWAMHQLYPEDNDSHRKVCEWIDQQLKLANREGNAGQIGERPLPPLGTYDYEIRTKGQVIVARRKEEKLLGDYRRWLRKQGRELQRLRLGRNECDAWEEERQNLIEAKATISRQDVRMAVGQLFDYAFQMREKCEEPNMAVLLPEKPHADDIGWLQPRGVKIVWRSGRRFRDDANRQFT